MSDTVLEVNASTGQVTTRPLTAQEIADRDAQAAAWAAEQAVLAALQANEDTLKTRATQALTANANFLAIASPTQAQTLAQVKTLTKECTALIRLLLKALDTIDDTA